VRFRDIDAFGHVNNAIFATYAEQARIRYLTEVLEADPVGRMPLILGMLHIDFRSPIMLDDTIEVGSRVEWLGGTSIGMAHRLSSVGDGRELAGVTSVLVAYDYRAARPMPVPDDWRRRLAAYEGRSLDRPPRGDS
jgi:acyl-CoA thioester hydrolase